MSRLDVEIKAMTLLRHKHIVSLDEVLETENQVFFVMELLEGGNLAEHAAIEPFKNDVARRFFYQILHGVYYCHSHHVYHRDLKLENVLLASDGFTVKVCDFGHAGISAGDWDIFSTSLIGSLFHISPEQMQNKCYSGEKVDIWALGVLLYRMLVGRPPFMADNGHDLMEKVIKGEFPESERLNPKALDLIHRILQPDPDARLSIGEIVKHPWMKAAPEIPSIPSLLAFSFSMNCIYINKTRTMQLLREILRDYGIQYHTSQRDYYYGSKASQRGGGGGGGGGGGTVITIRCRYEPLRLRFTVSVCSDDVYPTFINESGILGPSSTPDIDPQKQSQQQQSQQQSQQQQQQQQMPQQMPQQRSAQPQTNLTTVPAIAGAATGIEMDNTLEEESQEESEHISVNTNLNFTFSFNSGSGVKFREVAREIHRRTKKKLMDSALIKPNLELSKDIMLMTAERLAEVFRTSFEEELHKMRATVLLVGKTGCGKSSVANKVFRVKVAEVGQGKPVTKNFEPHKMPGMSVVVYDSKGFEVNSANQFKDEMDAYFAKCDDKVHVIWYVVDGTSSRFEPFEQEFLASSPLGAPVIVLVNKADLCASADIDALRAAVEAAAIPCVKDVVATSAAEEVLEPPPERCPVCGSDDISVLRKKLQWRCNGCDLLRDLHTKSSSTEGLDKVVDITHRLVPDKVKEAFVGSQYVSISSKLSKSYDIILEFFLSDASPDSKVVTLNVVKLMTRLCKLWDIATTVNKSSAAQSAQSSSSSLPASVPVDPTVVSSSSSATTTVPANAAIPETVASPLLYFEDDGSDSNRIASSFLEQFFSMISPLYKKSSHSRKKGSSNNNSNSSNGDGTNSNNNNNNIDGNSSTTEGGSNDGKKSGDGNNNNDDDNDDEKSSDDEFDDTDEEDVDGEDEEEEEEEEGGHKAEDDNLDWSFMENMINVMAISADTAGRATGPMNELKMKVRTIMAMAVVWTMSLMSLFLLLVDHGFDASTPKDYSKKSSHIIGGCVDRAFVYFNVDKILQVEKDIKDNGPNAAFVRLAKLVLKNTFPKLKTKKYDEESILRSVDEVISTSTSTTTTNSTSSSSSSNGGGDSK